MQKTTTIIKKNTLGLTHLSEGDRFINFGRIDFTRWDAIAFNMILFPKTNAFFVIGIN